VDPIADVPDDASDITKTSDKLIDMEQDSAKYIRNAIEEVNNVEYSGLKNSASELLEQLPTASLTPTQGKTLNKKEFQNLLSSIRRNGITGPIKCVQIGKDYYVVDGHHRLLAARLLGLVGLTRRRVYNHDLYHI
jgi:hypothetical protein